METSTMLMLGLVAVAGYLFGDDVLRMMGFDVDFNPPGDIDINGPSSSSSSNK